MLYMKVDPKFRATIHDDADEPEFDEPRMSMADLEKDEAFQRELEQHDEDCQVYETMNLAEDCDCTLSQRNSYMQED